MSAGLFFWFVCGAVWGSFFNVCIWRLPRRESLLTPASHCPACDTPIKPYDNVPILSFIFLGGKCRHCRQPIAWEYPLVEFLSGLFFAGAYYYYWPLPSLPLLFLKALLFFCLLLVISFIDLHFQIIPNRLSYPGLVLGLVLSWAEVSFNFSSWWQNYLLGALLGGGILLLIALVYPGGTGFGDVKLAAMLGAFLGIRAILVAIFSAYLLGAFISLVLIGLKIRSRKDAVPFGPFLSLGGLLAYFWGELIWQWYLTRLW